MTRNLSQNAGSTIGQMEDLNTNYPPQNMPISYELILYDKSTTDYNTAGKAKLHDIAIDVRIHEKLNADYVMDFKMPADNERFNMIGEGDFIKADGQLFIVRVVEKSRNDNGVMMGTVECEHIYFELIDHFIPSIVLYEKTTSQMMDALLDGTRFTYNTTEIVAIGDLQVTKRTGVQAIERFLNRFQAEILRNNFLLTFRDEIGQSKGTKVKYGKNQKNIMRQVDGMNVITRLYPYGKDGLTIESVNGDVAYIDSPNINVYATPRVKSVEFSDIEDAAELLVVAQEYLDDNDTPRVSYEVGLLELKALAGFDAAYESFNLGDTVDVEDIEMGIDLQARVVEYEHYLDRPEDSKIVLSNFIPDVTDSISRGGEAAEKIDGVVTDDGQISTERLQGRINTLRNQIFGSGEFTGAEIIEDGGILYENNNVASPSYGAMYIGPGIFALANAKLPDGSWDFRAFGNGSGFTADEIVAGKMSFSLLEGGIALLGGFGNGNGRLVVYNDQNEAVADLSAESGGFDQLFVGQLTSPSVENVNRESYTVYINALTGDDNNPGTSALPMQSVQATLDKIPKQNYGDIIIDVTSDLFESIEMDGYVGSGSINIVLHNNEVQGSIRVIGCTNMILLDDVELNTTPDVTESIRVERSSYVGVRSCKVFGNDVVARGLFVTRGSSVYVGDTEFNDLTNDCIYAETNSAVMVQNCKGLANYGIVAVTNSRVGASGTIPNGTTAAVGQFSAGTVVGTYTVDGATPPAPPAPPQTTRRFTEIEANSYRDNFGGQWSGTSGSTGRDVMQGQWQQWGLYRGCWFFGSTLSTTLTGKTIKQMRIYIKRISSGGYSAATPIYIKPHTHATRPGGAPTFLSPLHTVDMAWGEGKWITLPTSFHTVFANGTAKGIGIYTASTNNRYYSRMNGDITLEVVYQ